MCADTCICVGLQAGELMLCAYVYWYVCDLEYVQAVKMNFLWDNKNGICCEKHQLLLAAITYFMSTENNISGTATSLTASWLGNRLM